MARHNVILRSAITAALCSFAGISHAAYQNHPGYMCRQMTYINGNTGGAWLEPQEAIRYDGVYNLTNTDVGYYCPIVRDMSSFASGSTVGAVWVKSYRCATPPYGDLSDPVNCTAYALTPGGSLLTSSTLYAGADGVSAISLSGPTMPYTFGYRGFACNVPARCDPTPEHLSGVLSYRSAEQ